MVWFDRIKLGKNVEDLARQFLQKKGLHFLMQNYRCSFGEIDLIMQDSDDIVFVEVRCRHRIDYGNAFESITQNKINKLINTATHFLQNKGWLDKVNSRFDVIAYHPVEGKMQMEWIKNAF